jgi:hypothetical protein
MLHYNGNWQIGIPHNGNRFDVLKLMIRIESEIQQSSRRIALLLKVRTNSLWNLAHQCNATNPTAAVGRETILEISLELPIGMFAPRSSMSFCRAVDPA